MGLTNGALQIGQSALLSYESALQIVGNNIANAGVQSYSVQTPQLSDTSVAPLQDGLMSGGGVTLTGVQRNVDDALDVQLRSALSDQQNISTQQQTLSGIESLYNELGDSSLSSQLSAFFNAFQSVQSTPQDIPTREGAITAGQTLASQMQSLRSQLVTMYNQTNDQITSSTSQANSLASQIASLNLQIVQGQSGGQGATASLCDQRDDALKQLAQLMDIQTSQTPQGAVNVYVGSDPLVEGTQSRGLTTDQQQDGDRTIVSVHFADNDGTVQIDSGQIAGEITSRDQCIYGQIQQLDSLASNLIQQVNSLHSQGQGLTGFSGITSQPVLDPSAALNSSAAGLASTPTSGTFTLTVTDGTTGQPTQYQIPVSLPASGGDSLNSLANYISTNVSGVTASVTADNRLQITAGGNNTFTFGQDSSGVVAALGLNTFFTGTNASDIAVQANLAANPQLLAASSNGQPGDGTNAGNISDLASQPASSTGGQNLMTQWQTAMTTLANVSASATNSSNAAQNVAQSLQAQRDSVSGVSTDEETVNLMTYQRSYEAAAHYIYIVDQLVGEMLQMVQ